MTTKIKALAQAVQTVLLDLNDGATPTHTHYFKHVWIGMPKKVPTGNQAVATVEVASQPNYYYTTCGDKTNYDVDIIINVMVIGRVESATLKSYEIIEAVQTAFFNNQKISGTCIGSTIEEVVYGDYWSEAGNMVTGGKLTLRCRL